MLEDAVRVAGQVAVCETLWFRPPNYFDPDWRGTWSGSITNSLLSPRELSRIRVDLTGGTLEVDHVYGASDGDWSFSPAPDPATAATLGRDPGVRDGSGTLAADGAETTSADAWASSAGKDVPSNHGSQITQLVEDLLADRIHPTTLASARPTMELITAIYASALLGRPVQRDELVPGHPFYADLAGGIDQSMITARMSTGR